MKAAVAQFRTGVDGARLLKDSLRSQLIMITVNAQRCSKGMASVVEQDGYECKV
jgi:hypothetical protein